MRKRSRAMVCAVFLLSSAALAQFTTVTGTVTDPNGLPYAFGTIASTIVASGTPKFTATAQPYFQPTQASGLDGTGKFIVTLADNTQLTPGGSTWTFQVCSAGGTVLPSFGKGQVCFTVTGVTISGSSQDIGATLRAAAPALTVNFGTPGAGVTGSGTTNFLPEWATSTSLGNSPIQDQGNQGTYGLLNLGQGEDAVVGYFNATPGTYNANNGPFATNGGVARFQQTWANSNCSTGTPFCWVVQINANAGNLPASITGNELAAIHGFISDSGFPSGASSVGTLEGARFATSHVNGGLTSATNLFGMIATVQCGTGNVTTAAGCPTNSAGTFAPTNVVAGNFIASVANSTTMAALQAALAFPNNTSSSVATNAAGLVVLSPTSFGTNTSATHLYGILVNDPTAGGASNPDPHGITVLGGGIQQTIKRFTDLPSCGAATAGEQIPISDANTGTYNANITAGGGANQVIAYCNGTNWTAH